MLSRKLLEIYEEAVPHIVYLEKVKKILLSLEGKPKEDAIKTLKEYGKKADPTLRTDIKILLRYIEKQ